MATEEFIATISDDPVEVRESAWQVDPGHGAELRFLGVVREREDGRLIEGIDYTCYPTMALNVLREICRNLRAQYPGHRILVHHRIGFVPVGVPSLLIRLSTPHSAAAFDLARDCLERVKTTVPVWKRPVFAPAPNPGNAA